MRIVISWHGSLIRLRQWGVVSNHQSAFHASPIYEHMGCHLSEGWSYQASESHFSNGTQHPIGDFTLGSCLHTSPHGNIANKRVVPVVYSHAQLMSQKVLARSFSRYLSVPYSSCATVLHMEPVGAVCLVESHLSRVR